MKPIVGVVVLALAVAGSPVFAQSSCTPDEQTVFSCSVGQKRVSVCGSATLTAQTGYLQYRFGPPLGTLELTLPPERTHPGPLTSANTLTYSGGGGAYLRFTKGSYAYVVYTGIGKGWDRSGVVVEKDGKRIASLPCKGKVQSELGPDLFKQAGIPEDQGDFAIP